MVSADLEQAIRAAAADAVNYQLRIRSLGAIASKLAGRPSLETIGELLEFVNYKAGKLEGIEYPPQGEFFFQGEQAARELKGAHINKGENGNFACAMKYTINYHVEIAGVENGVLTLSLIEFPNEYAERIIQVKRGDIPSMDSDCASILLKEGFKKVPTIDHFVVPAGYEIYHNPDTFLFQDNANAEFDWKSVTSEDQRQSSVVVTVPFDTGGVVALYNPQTKVITRLDLGGNGLRYAKTTVAFHKGDEQKIVTRPPKDKIPSNLSLASSDFPSRDFDPEIRQMRFRYVRDELSGYLSSLPISAEERKALNIKLTDYQWATGEIAGKTVNDAYLNRCNEFGKDGTLRR